MEWACNNVIVYNFPGLCLGDIERCRDFLSICGYGRDLILIILGKDIDRKVCLIVPKDSCDYGIVDIMHYSKTRPTSIKKVEEFFIDLEKAKCIDEDTWDFIYKDSFIFANHQLERNFNTVLRYELYKRFGKL